MTKRNSKNSLSTLAETAEEYIKLECARRRNQPLARRRSMLQEQFQVVAPVSRLKERVAQARHHEFLVRKENRAALDAIIDSVRELVEGIASSTTNTAGSASNGDYRRSSTATMAGLSTMECARLLAWAADTKRVLVEFDPSDSHENDPIVRVIEQLQQLQDGPVCLAEVVVDARSLLERWDRAGVFDDQFDGDGSDSDSENDANRPTTSNRPARPLDQSYAYQNVRQRAAANCVKRNVLRWVRAKESFRQRVSEIELFGRTTESLLKELTSTSGTAAAMAMANDTPQDIFLVVRGRRVDRFANSIALADLMHFAKHVALFPVDQALRSLDVMARKRRLLDLRSAIKIQSTWRKARSIFQARRMFQAMELLRIEREKEAAALAEVLALAKAQAPQKNGKRKSTKPTSKKIRNSLALQTLLGASTHGAEENSEAKERSGSISAALTSRVRVSMMVAKRKESKVAADGKEAGGSLNGTPNGNRRQRTGGNDGREVKHGEDEPEDTSDVVNAWQAFLDSVKSQEEEDETKIEEDTSAVANSPDEPAGRPNSGEVVPEVAVVLPSMDENDWRDWSDDEDEALIRTDIGAHSDDNKHQRAGLDLPNTRDKSRPSVSRRSTSRESVSRGSNAAETGTARRRLTKQPTVLDQRRASRAFSSIVSTADLIKRLEQRPRLDRPSVLVPFADWSASVADAEQSSTSAEATNSMPEWSSIRSLRHLHEMDYHQLYPGVEELHVLRPLVDSRADSLVDDVETVAQQQQPQPQPQTMRVLPSPPSVVSVNRIYRSSQQYQPSRMVVVKQAIDDNGITPSVVTTPQQRAPNGPGLRIYRAPASRGQREFVVVKRPAMSETDDSATVQQKLSAHAKWMQTLDAHENVVGGSSSIVPIPPRHTAPSRLKVPRKGQLRAQEGKLLPHESAIDDGPESDDSDPRSQQSTPRFPSALPRSRPTNTLSAPSSEFSAVDEANPTSGVSEKAPKPLMEEVRRTLRFKSNEAVPSSTPSPSARDLTNKSDMSRSPDKTSYTRRPRPIDAGDEELPLQSGLDGRFNTRFAGRDGTRKRKLYLPMRPSAAHATGNHIDDSKVAISEDAIERRVVAFRFEYGEGIDGGRQYLTSSYGSVGGPLSGTPPVLETISATRPPEPMSRAAAPIRPTSSSEMNHSTSSREQPQVGLSAPSSALGSTIPPTQGEHRATSLAGARPLRQRQAQGAVANDKFATSNEFTPQSIEYGPLPPTVTSDPARSAAFNKLLQQYLGLLQCSPTGIRRPHRVNDP